MKRWIHVVKSHQGATKITISRVVTQREASDLVLAHDKGCAGLRVCADEKLRFAKGRYRVSLGTGKYLEHREWP